MVRGQFLAKSKVTARGQTTVPGPVRKALAVAPGAQLAYYAVEGGGVMLANMETETQDDPVLTEFLEFIARDMVAHPGRLTSFPTKLLERARELTRRASIDHSVAIEGEVAL